MKWQIASKWNNVRTWLEQTYKSSHFYEVLKTASAEIAVLLFVFPMIDMLGKESDKQRNWSLVIGSFGIGFIFIVLAGLFARLEQAGDEE